MHILLIVFYTELYCSCNFYAATHFIPLILEFILRIYCDDARLATLYHALFRKNTYPEAIILALVAVGLSVGYEEWFQFGYKYVIDYSTYKTSYALFALYFGLTWPVGITNYCSVPS